MGGEQEGFKRLPLMPENSVSADLQTESDKMVEWTDFERDTIQDIFSRIEYDVVGPAALARWVFVVLHLK